MIPESGDDDEVETGVAGGHRSAGTLRLETVKTCPDSSSDWVPVLVGQTISTFSRSSSTQRKRSNVAWYTCRWAVSANPPKSRKLPWVGVR